MSTRSLIHRVAALSKFARFPAPVLADKMRSRFWALVEQLLTESTKPGEPISLVWNQPASTTMSPAQRERCVDAAAQVLGGQITIFGHPVPVVRNGPDWQRDPLSDLTWPTVHHSKIDVLDLARPSDARIVWEINRCQHLIPLAQAHVLTGDEKYALGCLAQIDDWIQHNPVGIGINWTSSMEIAIRAVVWSWVLNVLRDSSSLTKERVGRISASMLAHGQHIERHLEHEEHSGNHYLANGLGLIVLGSAFRDTSAGQSWLARGRQIVDSEIPRQFYADGVNYEGSTAYHGLALELCLLAEVALRRLGGSLSSGSLERLERALDVALALTRSDGTYAAIGDVDDGHVLPLGCRRPRTHLHLLALGAALFARPNLAAPAAEAVNEVAWLLGEIPNSTVDDSPPGSSGTFPQGGLVILRDDTHHLIVDCGDVGSLGRGGHGHSDVLSFECFAFGQTLVVDGGTFTYSGDAAARERFRGTSQHNTLAVDDRETLEPADLWSFKQTGSPTLLRSSHGEDLDVFGGRFDLPGQDVRHERWIVFDRVHGAWLIDDRIVGLGVHHLVLRFHVLSRDLELIDDGARVTYSGSVGLLVQRIEGDWARSRIDRWSISPMYSQKSPSSVVVYEGSSLLPARCLTALVPYEGQCPDRDSVRAWAQSRTLPLDVAAASPGAYEA